MDCKELDEAVVKWLGKWETIEQDIGRTGWNSSSWAEATVTAEFLLQRFTHLYNFN